MVALLDTNVLLNFISRREDPFKDASAHIITECAIGCFSGCIAFHSLSTIWYVVKRSKNADEARFWLDHLCEFLTMVGASQQQVQDAIRNRAFRDFEDCLQDECAWQAGADYIVTCNVRDYGCAKVKAVSPPAFVHILRSAGKDSNALE